MEYFDKIVQLFIDNPELSSRPWWVYGIAALISACMLLAFRELCCWFWKLNKLVRRLERIEKTLKALENNQSPAPQPTPKKEVATPSKPKPQ